jgi:uncharacterized delta-60 repeat protein
MGQVLFVARLLPDGQVDPSFGAEGGGYVAFEFPLGRGYSIGLALQPDEKIVVGATRIRAVGNSESDAVVARFLDNGALDSSFGNGGTSPAPFTGSTYLYGLAMQGDSIVAASSLRLSARDGDAAGVFRLAPDGSLDVHFGVGGFAPAKPLETHEFTPQLAVDSSNRILLAGQASFVEGAGPLGLSIVRLTPSGSIDLSFGASGATAIPDVPAYPHAEFALAGDGGIYLGFDRARTVGATTTSALAVARIKSSGGAVPKLRMGTAIEFYWADRDHYFITADPAETQLLDSGQTAGWTRTGEQFPVVLPGFDGDAVSPVCRFYGRPERGLDSHFYSASLPECAAVIERFSESWIYESPNVFLAYLPDPVSGACPVGGVPVHRLFNGRSDANHRYTTSDYIAQTMIRKGWIAEGYGPGKYPVAFCATAF